MGEQVFDPLQPIAASGRKALAAQLSNDLRYSPRSIAKLQNSCRGPIDNQWIAPPARAPERHDMAPTQRWRRHKIIGTSNRHEFGSIEVERQYAQAWVAYTHQVGEIALRRRPSLDTQSKQRIALLPGARLIGLALCRRHGDFRLNGRDKPNQVLVAVGYSLLNGRQQLASP